MRKISANYIFPVSSKPVKNTYLLIDDSGEIRDIVSHDLSVSELAGLEYYSGIIIPAFVLAYANEAPVDFNSVLKPTQKAERIAWQCGVQAVGGFSFDANVKDNFIITECLEFLQRNEKETFEKILELLTLYGAKHLGLSSKMGSIEINKTPGILLLTGYNYTNKTISVNATLQRLV